MGSRGGITVTLAPALEAAASLHVLASPGHHPRQADWVRSCRSLSPDLKRHVREVSTAFRVGLPGHLRAAVDGDPGDHPELLPYWDGAFAEEYERRRPALEAEVDRVRRSIALHGLPDRLAGAAAGGAVIVLSTFVHPHTWFTPTRSRPVVVVPVTAQGPAPAIEDGVPHKLRAMASELRLTLLRLIASQPRSTKELAHLAYLSEPSVSRHLNQMATAGLVRRRREGYYVVYEIDRDGIDELSSALARMFPR